MKLLIIRHADALDMDGNSIRTDFDRPLSEKGVKQAIRLKKSLEKAELFPEIVLSSPLIRTTQTSKLVFPTIFSQNKTYFERQELQPGAYPEMICKIIKEFHPKSAAIVGHMPDVGIFVSWLIGASGTNIEMEKCGAALLDFDGYPREGAGSLRWLVGPQWKFR
ncbi:MAG: hypothetical protein EBT92_08485 [Planctomycetes bacterium]|nr:hypothetical protein [Planctomycetota bacterium]NBY03449.1 hypothetical protein [Planctomycetota bacterium]